MFSDNRDGDDEIFVMNPDGSGVQQLTSNAPLTPRAASDASPAFSPDGRLIVFTSDRDFADQNSEEIYLMTADGRRERRLTRNRGSDYSPTFSPDGRRLVYGSCGGERLATCGLVTATLTGPARRRLTTGFVGDPAWSPDGRRSAYWKMHGQSHFQHFELHVMRADGSDDEQLTDDETGDGSPAWSPDGTRIAFASNRAESARCFTFECVGYTNEFYVMEADGDDVTRLTRTPEEEYSPAWSPDGARIVFTRSAKDQESEIWMMNADGSCPRRLTTGSAPDWYGPAGATVGRIRC